MPGEVKKSPSALDKQLLKAAMSGKRSGTALSEAVNGMWSPEESALRLTQILEEQTWLSLEQNKKLVILSAMDLYSRMEKAWSDGDAKPMDVINAFKVVADRFDKAQADSDDVLNRISRAQGEVFAGAIQVIMATVIKMLDDRGKNIPELEAIVVEAVPVAVKQIEASVDV